MLPSKVYISRHILRVPCICLIHCLVLLNLTKNLLLSLCHYRKSNNVLWLGLAPDVFPYLSGLLHWRRDNRTMGLLPDTWNCRLHMRQEYRELFPRHQCEMKLRVSDPTKHHGRCVMHVPWCMSGLLTRGGGENVPGIPGACTTRNFTYLARCP